MGDKASGAADQQGSISWPPNLLCKFGGIYPSETTRRAPLSKEIIKAYFLGALHDGVFSSNRRFRISQKGRKWLEILQSLLS
jgi:hypothetical protein